MFVSQLLLWGLSFLLVSSAAGYVCYLGQEPDPVRGGQLRWVLPTHDPCRCTRILPGGVAMTPQMHATHFIELDCPLFTDDADEIQIFFDCGHKENFPHEEVTDPPLYLNEELETTQIDDRTIQTLPQLPPHCQALREQGYATSMVYNISIPGYEQPTQVYCDMQTDGGGWIVIFRRYDGSVDFDRWLDDYREGFGDLTGEFWLGNEKMRKLIEGDGTGRQWQIQVDLWISDLRISDIVECSANTVPKYYFARYEFVSISGQDYELLVKNYTENSTAGDFLSLYNGEIFNVYNKLGGWWYNVESNRYQDVIPLTSNECYKPIHCPVEFVWATQLFTGDNKYWIICKSEMKIRPI